MLTSQKVRLILITPAIVAIILLAGCFDKKETIKKGENQNKNIVKTTKNNKK